MIPAQRFKAHKSPDDPKRTKKTKRGPKPNGRSLARPNKLASGLLTESLHSSLGALTSGAPLVLGSREIWETLPVWGGDDAQRNNFVA